MSGQDRLLLDTHVFLWWRADSPRLRPEIRGKVGAAGLVYVSAASAWEGTIKAALGKLRLPGPFSVGVAESRFEQLPVTFEHAEAVAELPGHHRDPFDRLLIAQARCEGLVVVTHDQRFRAYDVPVLWV